MGTDGFARRPGLVLAGCAWAGFAAPAAVAVEQAATMDGAFHTRVFAASLGFADLPSFCLVVAALLVLLEQLAAPTAAPAVDVVAGAVLVSAAVSVVMTVAGVVVLRTWSTPTPGWEWVGALSPALTAAVLAGLAALVADRALRGPQPSEYAT